MTLSAKLDEELGQNRHWPGVKGCMVARREPVKAVELVSVLDDELIGVVVAVVVAVAVSGMDLTCAK